MILIVLVFVEIKHNKKQLFHKNKTMENGISQRAKAKQGHSEFAYA